MPRLSWEPRTVRELFFDFPVPPLIQNQPQPPPTTTTTTSTTSSSLSQSQSHSHSHSQSRKRQRHDTTPIIHLRNEADVDTAWDPSRSLSSVSRLSSSINASHTVTDWDRAVLQQLCPIQLSIDLSLVDSLLELFVQRLAPGPGAMERPLSDACRTQASVASSTICRRLADPYPGNEHTAIMHWTQTLADHAFVLYDQLQSESESQSATPTSSSTSRPPLPKVRGWTGLEDGQHVQPDLICDMALLDGKRRLGALSDEAVKLSDEADAMIILGEDHTPVIRRITGQELPASVTSVIVQVIVQMSYHQKQLGALLDWDQGRLVVQTARNHFALSTSIYRDPTRCRSGRTHHLIFPTLAALMLLRPGDLDCGRRGQIDWFADKASAAAWVDSVRAARRAARRTKAELARPGPGPGPGPQPPPGSGSGSGSGSGGDTGNPPGLGGEGGPPGNIGDQRSGAGGRAAAGGGGGGAGAGSAYGFQLQLDPPSDAARGNRASYVLAFPPITPTDNTDESHCCLDHSLSTPDPAWRPWVNLSSITVAHRLKIRARKYGLRGGWGHFIPLSALYRYRLCPLNAPDTFLSTMLPSVSGAAPPPVITPPSSPLSSIKTVGATATAAGRLVLDDFVAAGAIWDAYAGRIIQDDVPETESDTRVIIKICDLSSYLYHMRTFGVASEGWSEEDPDDAPPIDARLMVDCWREVQREIDFYRSKRAPVGTGGVVPAFHGVYVASTPCPRLRGGNLIVEVLEDCGRSIGLEEVRDRRTAILDLYDELHRSGYTHGDVTPRHIVVRGDDAPAGSDSSGTQPKLTLIDFGRVALATENSRREEMGMVRRMLLGVSGRS